MQVTPEGILVAIGITGTEVAVLVAQAAAQGEVAHLVAPRGIGSTHVHVMLEAGVCVQFISAVILHAVVALVQAHDVLAAHLQQVMPP